jgi:SAM-dependent methyltransferase
LAKRLHPRSPVAQRTAGITLDHAAPLYDWLAPLMTLGSEHRLHRRSSRASPSTAPPPSSMSAAAPAPSPARSTTPSPSPRPRRVCGVDAAEAMIAVAHKKAGPRPGLEFAAALAEDLPYPDASFDRALSTFFFHHLNYGLKVKSLAELWRVLRPGGQAAILDVDIPYTRFGKLCAWSGYWLFRQPEIAENIHGKPARRPRGIPVARPLDHRLPPLRLPQPFRIGQTPGETP